MGFDGQKRCLGCMKLLAWDGRCSCGFDRRSYLSDSHYLPLGSFLKNGDYMIGKVLGEGGFGITYMGFDQNLLSRVAIKEYYPAGFAGRDVTNGNCNVCAYGGDAREIYKKGLDAFLKEARILARFSGIEGIVKVRCLFQENETAYIVMEYVEGVSIKNYVQQYGRIRPELVWEMMEQPIRALQAVHEENLVHRDISADNLMIGQNGRITLIDFGAARSSNVMDERTRTTICKQGFSALEQYSREGKQGPWTDVYGICATMYYMLTGITPKSSTERIVGDMVVPLNRMDDILLGQDKKEALMTGMAVRSSGRFQNMEALYSALYGESLNSHTDSGIIFQKEEKPDSPVKKRRFDGKVSGVTALMGEALQKMGKQRNLRKRRKLYGKIAGGMAVVLLLALILWSLKGYIPTNSGVREGTGNSRLEQQVEVKPTDTPEPSRASSNHQVKPVSETDSTPQAGSIPPADSVPQGTVSKAVKMPKVAGLKKADAVKRIKKKGLRYSIVLNNSSKYAEGIVIRASVSAGKTVKEGKKIILYVSKGKKLVPTPRPTEPPKPKAATEPPAAKKPAATKKPGNKQNDNLAGDLDTILY